MWLPGNNLYNLFSKIKVCGKKVALVGKIRLGTDHSKHNENRIPMRQLKSKEHWNN